MIPAPFEYVRAASVEEALQALADPEAKVLAGGHSLLPLMKLRLARPSLLVDVGRLELRGVADGGGALTIGALTTYDELIRALEDRPAFAALREAAAHVGDVQVRNGGTIGGGLAHADPAADVPAAVLALGGGLRLRSQAELREVAATDFFLGPFTTALAQEELLVEIVFPARSGAEGSAYVSFDDPASGYARAGAAVRTRRNGNGVEEVAVAVTGFTSTPRRLPAVEEIVARAGREPPVEAVEDGLAGLEIHADDSEHRRRLAAVAVVRAAAVAFRRAAGEVED